MLSQDPWCQYNLKILFPFLIVRVTQNFIEDSWVEIYAVFVIVKNEHIHTHIIDIQSKYTCKYEDTENILVVLCASYESFPLGQESHMIFFLGLSKCYLSEYNYYLQILSPLRINEFFVLIY